MRAGLGTEQEQGPEVHITSAFALSGQPQDIHADVAKQTWELEEVRLEKNNALSLDMSSTVCGQMHKAQGLRKDNKEMVNV